MQIHRCRWTHNYDTTQEIFEVEKIVGVFGHVENRWLQVKWKWHPEPEWERQHLIEWDGCHKTIKEFWSKSGLNPCKQFYPDTDGRHRCEVCCKVYKRAQVVLLCYDMLMYYIVLLCYFTMLCYTVLLLCILWIICVFRYEFLIFYVESKSRIEITHHQCVTPVLSIFTQSKFITLLR